MTDAILVLNAGSSSIKFAIYSTDLERMESCHMEVFASAGGHAGALAPLLDRLTGPGADFRLVGAGHRVVHGGTDFTGPVLLTEEAIDQLAALEPLAPHHQPHNVAAIRALAERLPDLPHVACFDTAFHATQPGVARNLGLPAEYSDRGIIRYGFHGSSYEYIVGAFEEVTGVGLPKRLAIAHLGNGASMCAVLEGKSVATTMGFSTLDGIPMGTRSGALDPGVILHLMREDKLDLTALEDLLYNRSGLLGVSGISADMRQLLESDEEGARTAIDYYGYRICRELGSLAAALGGLDGLVFTGGIGENAAKVRADIIGRSGWLGLELDSGANDSGGPLITRVSGKVQAWVLATDEERVIARHTLDALKP